MTARVAVVVLNWNGWPDTVACVRSLQKQTLEPAWIVVVDNASTDDSEQQLRTLEPGVTLLQSGRNLGYAGGNNVGIRWALMQGADAVWLLNNDAVADESALESLVATHETRPRAGAIGTLIYEAKRPDTLQCWGGGWVNLWTGRAREYSVRVSDSKLQYISGCSLYMPRLSLETAGLLDEGFFMYFEDIELSLRYQGAGFELAVAEGARVFHLGGASSRPGRQQSAWRTQSLLRILRLHAPAWQLSVALSTILRGTSMLLRREWQQIVSLGQDVTGNLLEPDWRRSQR